VIDAANQNVEDMVRKRQAEAALHDQRAVRVNLVLRPRTAAEVRATKMRVDTDVSKVEFFDAQGRPVDKYFADSIFYSPKESVQFARVEQTMVTRRDLIVVTYAAVSASVETKKVLFKHAIEHILARIQSMIQANSVKASLVKVGESGRTDLFGQMRILPANCNLLTCKASFVEVIGAEPLKEKIASALSANVGADGNVVLSLWSDAKDSPVIHIVDVLVADARDAKGLDDSWIAYLEPTIQQNNVNIDLFFNLVPAGENAKVEETNKNLLQLSYRLVQFLNAFRLSGRR
jgi:hypothetical protein